MRVLAKLTNLTYRLKTHANLLGEIAKEKYPVEIH
jgi:hypothetical protein